MAGRVDQVHLICFPVLRFIVHAHGTGFDRNAALTFQIHIVQQLAFHFALGNGMALFQQAVSQRGFAVVDVRHNRKIADERLVFHDCSFCAAQQEKLLCGRRSRRQVCPPFYRKY